MPANRAKRGANRSATVVDTENEGSELLARYVEEVTDPYCPAHSLCKVVNLHRLCRCQEEKEAAAEAKGQEGKATNFNVGDHVLGLFGDGQWYGATLLERKKRKWLLEWDDGDVQDRLKVEEELREDPDVVQAREIERRDGSFSETTKTEPLISSSTVTRKRAKHDASQFKEEELKRREREVTERERDLKRRHAALEVRMVLLETGMKVKREKLTEWRATLAQLTAEVLDKRGQLNRIRESAVAQRQQLEELDEKIEEIESSMLCSVCFEWQAATALMPCGHCFCCDTECGSSRPDFTECPSCRQTVTGRRRVFGTGCTDDIASLRKDIGAVAVQVSTECEQNTQVGDMKCCRLSCIRQLQSGMTSSSWTPLSTILYAMPCRMSFSFGRLRRGGWPRGAGAAPGASAGGRVLRAADAGAGAAPDGRAG